MSQKFEFSSLAKADPQKMQWEVTVYKSGTPDAGLDTQGEFMTRETLTKAAHDSVQSVRIDVAHDGKALHPSHARPVELWVDDDGKQAIWKALIQFSKQAWDQLIAPGKLKAVSIGGQAGRVVHKNAAGNTVREIVSPVIEFISLVERGATGEVAVAKADAPAWAATLVDQLKQMHAKVDALDHQIDALKGRGLGKSSGSTPIDVRKTVLTEHAVRNEAKLADLRAMHLAKSEALQAIWEGQRLPGESGVQSEQRLCRELYQLEVEMSALGKSSAVDVTDPRHSAFTFRGGESTRLRATPSDSGFELRPTSLTKAEEEIDLSSLRI